MFSAVRHKIAETTANTAEDINIGTRLYNNHFLTYIYIFFQYVTVNGTINRNYEASRILSQFVLIMV